MRPILVGVQQKSRRYYFIVAMPDLSGNVEISGGSYSFLKDESAGNEKIVDNFNLERETLVLNWPMVCRCFSW